MSGIADLNQSALIMHPVHDALPSTAANSAVENTVSWTISRLVENTPCDRPVVRGGSRCIISGLMSLDLGLYAIVVRVITQSIFG